MCAGNGEDEIDEHTAVKGKLGDGAAIDDFAEGAVGGLKEFGGGGDIDGLGGAGDAEREVEIGGADLELERAGGGGKGVGVDVKLEAAGSEGAEGVEAGGVSVGGAGGAGGECAEGEVSVGDRAVVRVRDEAGEGGVVALGVTREKDRREESREEQEAVWELHGFSLSRSTFGEWPVKRIKSGSTIGKSKVVRRCDATIVESAKGS